MTSRNPRMPLVSAVDVTKEFVTSESFLSRRLGSADARRTLAVDGVTLDVYPGQTVGLVGESGCGKSTFGRTLVGLTQPTSGQVFYDGSAVWGRDRLGRGELKGKAQIIFQNPYSSLNPRYTVVRIIGTALAARGVAPADREQEAHALIRRVGLAPDHLDRYPHQLSGGQRQRVGIARALAMRPQFIVADEPLSSLDVSVQAQIIGLLQDLQSEYGLSYLLISHDLRVVYHMSDAVAVMYRGQIVESAPSGELFAHPSHPYTQQLLLAIPGSGRRLSRRHSRKSGAPHSQANLQAQPASRRGGAQWAVTAHGEKQRGCVFAHRCPNATRLCSAERPILAPLAEYSDHDCSRARTQVDAARPAHLVRCHRECAS